MCRCFSYSATLAGIFLTSCSGGGGIAGAVNGGKTPPQEVSAAFSFPAGDATSVQGGTAWDIIGVKTTLSGSPGRPAGNSYDTLRVDVTFVQDISLALPAPGLSLLDGTQLGVGIALDVDGRPSTGEYATCDAENPIRPFEYFSDIGTATVRFADGNYAIVDPSGNFVSSGSSNPAGEAVTTVLGHVFTQSFYLPAIAVFSATTVPRIGVGVAAYNGAGIASTDCVPKLPSVEMFTR